MKSSYDFEVVCKNALIKELKEQYGEDYSIEDIDFVWYNYTLRNNKAILIDKGDNKRIYECTYNSNKEELYVDIYDKQFNIVVPKNCFDHEAKPREE